MRSLRHSHPKSLTLKKSSEPKGSAHSHFVARQPVFTRQGKLWGYELLFRNGMQGAAIIPNAAEATAEVMIDGLALLFSGNRSDIKAFINIPASMLESGMLDYMPRESCVLEILEDVPATPDVLKTVQRLKSNNYTLALDDYVGQDSLSSFLPLVDIVKVDFLNMSEERRKSLTIDLNKIEGLKLLAEKVETLEDAEQAKKLGYGFMQGFYFQKPEIFGGSKVPATVTSRLHALWLLSNEDIEQRDLQEFFIRSPQLTFRLLKFVNSAAFAKTRQLQHLESAMAFLGLRRVRQWLTAVLLADGQRNDTKYELACMGTARASFMQSAALLQKLPKPDAFFMTGLFSLLHALYNIPFEMLLGDLPLDNEVKQALILQTGPIAPWLRLTETLERGEFSRADKLAFELGVRDMVAILQLYNSALRWSRDTLQ